jgi:predicted nucleic acid-binding protein
MGILIDTSILIDFERGLIDITPNIKGREQEEFFLSVITASELLHGVFRAKDFDIRSRRSAFVEGILERFSIIPIDLPTARIHSQLWANLESYGIMIGLHDLWIAATCISNGCTLVTSNLREFERVHGLKVECWAAKEKDIRKRKRK